MSVCTVRIETSADGENSVFCSHGVYAERENGFSVRYFVGGDGAEISLSGGTLKMAREGSARLSAHFRKDRQTVMTFHEGPSAGELPVFTEELSCEADPKGKVILLHYRLGAGEEPAFYRLKILISFSEEG